MLNDKFFEISLEITDRYDQILELTPKESNYLWYLTESLLLFTRFVLLVSDEFNVNRNNESSDNTIK